MRHRIGVEADRAAIPPMSLAARSSRAEAEVTTYEPQGRVSLGFFCFTRAGRITANIPKLPELVKRPQY